MGDDDNFDPTEVYLYRGEGRIPRNAVRAEVHPSVKFIPEGLFQHCRQLESVILHEGLLRIGMHAFFYCSSLEGFRCPSTVTEIMEGAFESCWSLAAVALPEGLDSIEAETFCECTSLGGIRIPGTVARIGDHAFLGCADLATVELREGVRTIGEGAFGRCRSLDGLRVPSSVVEIGSRAFYACRSLSAVQLREDLPTMKRFAFGGCPSVSFRFIQLSRCMEAISMDDRTRSVFESRLSEITLAMTETDHDDGEAGVFWEHDDGGEAGPLWERCKKSLGRAHEVLTYLELKGGAPVLELALWKTKIEGEGEERLQGDLANNEDKGQDLSNAVRERKRPKVAKNIGQDTLLSRKDCRVKCGAAIALAKVLKFFTYSSSWPRFDDSEEENVDD